VINNRGVLMPFGGLIPATEDEAQDCTKAVAVDLADAQQNSWY